ncbi:hypothetical protein BGW37DRAFT_552910 [Umbelopsis sp. PMI_123]|nr:hypothetical protein BGW37DRAFT_552910 [Umbelopsis sp. PMI_123]
MNVAMEDKESATPKANIALEKRVYIGGLPRSLTAEDLRNRFKMFGEIVDASIAKDIENQCRGFGHITIKTTTNQWTKCVSVYNNAKWKGGVMKIEDAKPGYKEKIEAEKQEIKLKQEQKEEKAKKRKRVTDSDGFLARDMTLINDKNVDGRKGWKRGRYGRGIAVMRLTKDNGTKFVFDPSHYKNNLLKLYDIKVRMKPTRSLPMYYEDVDDAILEPYDHASDLEENNAMQEDSESEDDTVQHLTAIESQTLPQKLTKEQVNEKRLQTLELRELERQKEKERIATMLAQVESGKRKDGHITFDDDEKETKQTEDESDNDETVGQHQSKDAMKWMFDSDEDDEDDTPAFNINPVMEGEKGRERLELQRTFGGDERFKLGADFMDDDSEDEEPWNQEKQADNSAQDEISAELSQEKSTSLDVLRAMFGEDNRTALREIPKSVGWTPGLRFDPDEEDTDLLVDTTQPVESQITEEAKPQQQKDVLPEVSTDKHFQVNINLKPLFTPGAQETPFKLFGGDTDTDAEEEEPEEIEDEGHESPIFDNDILVQSQENNIIQAQPSLQQRQQMIQNAPFFFFHFGNQELSKRSNYKDEGVFMRTDSMEKVTATWESVRQELTQVFKKKHKSATKLKAKMMRSQPNAK